MALNSRMTAAGYTQDASGKLIKKAPTKTVTRLSGATTTLGPGGTRTTTPSTNTRTSSSRTKSTNTAPVKTLEQILAEKAAQAQINADRRTTFNAATAAGVTEGDALVYTDRVAPTTSFSQGRADTTPLSQLNTTRGGTAVSNGAGSYQPIGDYLDRGVTPSIDSVLNYWGNIYNTATDPKLKEYAHEQAQLLRQSQGYLGKEDGSGFVPITTQGENVGSVEPGGVTAQRVPGVRDIQYNFAPTTPELRTVQDLAKNYLGDITFDEEAILGKFQQRTRDEFATKGEKLRGAEAQFGRNLFDTGLTARDALRRANASAVATGASRGVQAAQELSSILGLEQEATGAATELAQARALLGTQEAEALSQDVVDALTTSNQLKKDIGALGRDLYTADTQFRVGEMDYYANLENTIKNLEGILAQTGTSLDVADINRDGQITAEEIRAAATRYGAEQDRAARTESEKIRSESYENVAKINAATEALRAGTATTQQKEDYAAGLARYVADGNQAAYISTLTSMNIPYDKAAEMWEKATGQLDTLDPENTEGWFDKLTSWISNEAEYISNVAANEAEYVGDVVSNEAEYVLNWLTDLPKNVSNLLKDDFNKYQENLQAANQSRVEQIKKDMATKIQKRIDTLTAEIKAAEDSAQFSPSRAFIGFKVTELKELQQELEKLNR